MTATHGLWIIVHPAERRGMLNGSEKNLRHDAAANKFDSICQTMPYFGPNIPQVNLFNNRN